MTKLIWSRNMTRDRLHESEDKRKDLIDFYDYDELLETLDDDQVDDLIDSDERMPAMDNAYYDEDVRPKIEAQTFDGIVLLVERPEEEEEPEEEPEVSDEPTDEPVEEDFKKGDKIQNGKGTKGEVIEPTKDGKPQVKLGSDVHSYSDNASMNKVLKKNGYKKINEADEEVEDDLPELEGMAILADEIPEEFPEAKIVDDGDGFVLEDGDTKYDMYAIPEDKVEEFMDTCMEDPMEDVIDEDEEFESDMELDVDSINDNCDFSKVPEVCERITGEPEEEEVDSVEDDLGDGQGEPVKADDLEEAAVTSNDSDNIDKEAEELNSKAEEYGIDYFTAMPFSNYENDPISFEHQYPAIAKLWRAFFKEVLEITDDDQIDEVWDTDIDQNDWNTVMKAATRLATNARKKGKVHTQMEKEYAAQRNSNESLKEGLEDVPFVERVSYDNGISRGLPGIRNVNKLAAELDRIASEVGPKFKVRTTRFGSGVSRGDLKDAWMSLKRAGWSVSEETDNSLDGFNRVYVCSKIDESLKEGLKTYACDDCGYETEMPEEEYDGRCPKCGNHHGNFNPVEYDESLNEDDFFGARDYTIDNGKTPAPGSDRTAIRNAKMIKAALIREWGDDYFDQLEIGKDHGEIVVEVNKEFGHYTYVCYKDGSIDMSYSRMDEVTHTISAEDFKEFDSIKDWFEWEDIDVGGQDEPELSVQDESLTITEAPHYDSPEDAYDAEGQEISPEEAQEDIDDFLEDEITLERFSDFDEDDRAWGKEDWIKETISDNYDVDDLIKDWYEKYNYNSVEAIENEATDYFYDKAQQLLSKVWDHYAGTNEELLSDSEPSAESVDPDDGLTESDEWPWGDPGKLK